MIYMHIYCPVHVKDAVQATVSKWQKQSLKLVLMISRRAGSSSERAWARYVDMIRVGPYIIPTTISYYRKSQP
jgi:hypothetical protein